MEVHVDNSAVVEILSRNQKLLSAPTNIDDNFDLEEPTGEANVLTPSLKADHSLSPEWDLLANLEPLMSYNQPWLNDNVSWIASHQDKKKPYLTLTLEAQLNCDADQLANQAHNITPLHNYSIVPLTEACPVHLDINGKTATSKFQSTIRKEWNYKALQAHIASRNNWTPTTTKSVDWSLHKRALSKKISHKVHYCKLVHDILPTNERLAKWDPF